MKTKLQKEKAIKITTTESIDWEARRYEIAKAMLTVTSERVDMYGYKINRTEATKSAIDYADALIEELKELRKK